MKVVLFYRDFKAFSGGHLKVWHYFNHVLLSQKHVPKIYFSNRSRWDASNPWQNAKPYILESGALAKPDVIFLAGMDWLSLTETQREYSPVPIINLIQGLRHARPKNRHGSFRKKFYMSIRKTHTKPFGIRDSGFGVRDSGFGVRGSGFGVRGSGFGIRDSGFGMERASMPRFRITDRKYQSKI